MTARPRILVVDDEDSVTLTLCAVLDRAGYHAQGVLSLAEALARIAVERFDVAIVDLALGEANGLSVIERLRQIAPETVAIILTGYGTLGSATEAIRLGAFDYLAKPCNLDELKAAVARGLRKRIEDADRLRAEIEAERRRLFSILSQVPAVIAVTRGPSHVLELANPSLLRLVGCPDSSVLAGKTIREALPQLEGQGFFELIDQVYATGEPFVHAEVPVHLPRGDELKQRFFSLVLQPFREAGKVVEGVMLHAVEVSELVEARRRVEALATENARLFQEAQAAVRIRDEFLAVAAHELKSPLAAIHLLAEGELRLLARVAHPDSEQIGTTLHRINQETGKLTEMIGKLLDIARLDAGKLVVEPTTIDVAGLVRETVAIVRARDADHPIEVDAPATLEGRADEMRLGQVVTNLLDNAVKYTPPGTPIEVTVRSTPDRITIAVRDQGPGVPPQCRSHIFERFFQVPGNTQSGGLGLGLFISREIVELHGGTLQAEFPDAGGTSFAIGLPRHAPLPPDRPPTRRGARP